MLQNLHGNRHIQCRVHGKPQHFFFLPFGLADSLLASQRQINIHEERKPKTPTEPAYSQVRWTDSNGAPLSRLKRLSVSLGWSDLPVLSSDINNPKLGGGSRMDDHLDRPPRQRRMTLHSGWVGESRRRSYALTPPRLGSELHSPQPSESTTSHKTKRMSMFPRSDNFAESEPKYRPGRSSMVALAPEVQNKAQSQAIGGALSHLESRDAASRIVFEDACEPRVRTWNQPDFTSRKLKRMTMRLSMGPTIPETETGTTEEGEDAAASASPVSVKGQNEILHDDPVRAALRALEGNTTPTDNGDQDRKSHHYYQEPAPHFESPTDTTLQTLEEKTKFRNRSTQYLQSQHSSEEEEENLPAPWFQHRISYPARVDLATRRMKTLSLYAARHESGDIAPSIPPRSSLRVDTSARRRKVMSMYTTAPEFPQVSHMQLPNDYRRDLAPAPLRLYSVDTSRKLKAMSMYSPPTVHINPVDEVSPTAPTLCEEQPLRRTETRPRKLKRRSLYVSLQGQVASPPERVLDKAPEYPPRPKKGLEAVDMQPLKPKRVSRLRRISALVVRFFH